MARPRVVVLSRRFEDGGRSVVCCGHFIEFGGGVRVATGGVVAASAFSPKPFGLGSVMRRGRGFSHSLECLLGHGHWVPGE